MKIGIFHKLAVIGAIVSIMASIALYAFRAADVSCERAVFQGARGKIVGDIYRPVDSAAGLSPGVLICHGVENNKEMASHLAVEFARRSYVSMAFDYGGYGESDSHGDDFDLMVADTMAALEFLEKLPGVDRNRLALVGHSMGVSYAVAAGELKGNAVRAVVGLGNEATSPGSLPRNLMLAMGIYDAFHTLPDMLQAVRDSAGNQQLEPYRISGDFSRGDARSLFISPISEHGMEPLDPILIAQSIKWIDMAMAVVRDRNIRVKETYRAEARLVLMLAMGMFLTSILILFYDSKPDRFAVISRLPFIAIILAAVIGNISLPWTALFCADAAILILASASVAAHLARPSGLCGNAGAIHELPLRIAARKLAFGWAFIGAVLVSLLAGLLIHGVPTAVTRLEWAKGIPQFLFHVLLIRPYEGLCMLRAYAFIRYSQGWLPEIWFGAAMIIELIHPGAFVWIAGKVAQTLVRAFKLKGPFKLGASRKSYGVLAAAAIALLVVLFRRLKEGWLSGEALRRMAFISLKFLIIPLIIFIAILNLPFFSREIKHEQ